MIWIIAGVLTLGIPVLIWWLFIIGKAMQILHDRLVYCERDIDQLEFKIKKMENKL